MQKPKETTQNAIYFISKALGEDLIIFKVNDKTVVLVVARKVLSKYHLQQPMLTKVACIRQGVEKFKEAFQPLFLKGLPNFLDSKGKLIPEALYVESLVKARADHARF